MYLDKTIVHASVTHLIATHFDLHTKSNTFGCQHSRYGRVQVVFAIRHLIPDGLYYYGITTRPYRNSDRGKKKHIRHTLS